MNTSVLKRYALAYIKKSGSNDNVKEFLQHCNNTRSLTWNEQEFDRMYGEFTHSIPTRRHSTGYSAPICLDHFFESDPIFKVNMLINTSTHT